MGIEPTFLQSQYNALPLNYYHLQGKGLEPSFLISKTTSFHLDDPCWHRRDLNPQNLRPKLNVSTISPRCQKLRWELNPYLLFCKQKQYHYATQPSSVRESNPRPLITVKYSNRWTNRTLPMVGLEPTHQIYDRGF